MKHINSFELFLEFTNPNTPQGYLNSLNKKPKLKTNIKSNQPPQKPTDEVDKILLDTEEQKQRIIAQKDAIEKGFLNSVGNTMEPENKKTAQVMVNDYKNQVKEFDKTVKQIGQLNKTLKKSNVPVKKQSNQIQTARTQNQF